MFCDKISGVASGALVASGFVHVPGRNAFACARRYDAGLAGPCDM